MVELDLYRVLYAHWGISLLPHRGKPGSHSADIPVSVDGTLFLLGRDLKHNKESCWHAENNIQRLQRTDIKPIMFAVKAVLYIMYPMPLSGRHSRKAASIAVVVPVQSSRAGQTSNLWSD